MPTDLPPGDLRRRFGIDRAALAKCEKPLVKFVDR
jgi:hypothetical protein|tara:strand:+ start:170 stop:274 length:105 start_codon:yes stop_codon:yes gene_type:complete